MTPDEIHKYLKDSVYSGLFDLIGACIARSIYGKDRILVDLTHSNKPFAINIEYLFKYSNCIKDSGGAKLWGDKYIEDNMAIEINEDREMYYKVTRPLLENNTELHKIKSRFFDNKVIHSDIINIFKKLFEWTDIEVNSGRCDRVMSAAPNYIKAYRSRKWIMPKDDLGSWHTRVDGNFNYSRTPILYSLFKNDFLVFQSRITRDLYWQVLESPFWYYIQKYKLIQGLA